MGTPKIPAARAGATPPTVIGQSVRWRAAYVLRVVREQKGSIQLSLKALSAEMGVSEQHLGRVLRMTTGLTFRAYLRRVRADEAKRLLRNPAFSVKDVANLLGYSDGSNFVKDFRGATGTTPVTYRLQFELSGGARSMSPSSVSSASMQELSMDTSTADLDTLDVVATARATRIEHLLGEMTPDVFKREYLGRRSLLLPGSQDRFNGLLTWTMLNELLETRSFTAAALRMKKAGKDIPVESYLTEYTRFNRPPIMTTISPRVITDEMRDGATLIINSIQKMVPSIATLAEDLEHVLQARININMYASLVHDKNCFGCHYDVHDVLVLQVQGRKHWQLFGPRPLMPYPHESFDSTERPPTVTPTWDGLMTQGDALYMPRGWWHFARPIGGPTIHLSVGIVKPTGLDLLEWLTKQMGTDDIFRKNLPQDAQEAVSCGYLDAVRDAVTARMAQPDLLETFLQDRANGEGVAPGMKFGLPWSANEEVLPPSAGALIYPTSAVALKTYPSPDGDGMIQLYAAGKPALSFRKSVVALCDYLQEHSPVPVHMFMRRFQSEFNEETLRSFLRQLSLKHLIVVKATEE